MIRAAFFTLRRRTATANASVTIKTPSTSGMWRRSAAVDGMLLARVGEPALVS